MKRSPGVLAALVGILAFALTYLAVQSAAPDQPRHERTLESMRMLHLADAALQRDVLRARAGLLGDYDPLVSAVGELRRAAVALGEAGSPATGEARAEIERRANAVRLAVEDQEALVETFKSQNALLRNSLAYFNHLSQQLGGPSGGLPEEETRPVGELSGAMLRFDSGQDEAGEDVRAALAKLGNLNTPRKPGIRALVSHGQLILGNLPAVDDLVGRILGAPIGERARALHDAYLDFYAGATARADVFGTILYAAALALVVYLGYLFVRLSQNDRILRARLSFENLIAAISTQFIDLPSDRIDAGIDAGIAKLGKHVGVDRVAVVIGDEAQAERYHAWRRADDLPPDLPPRELLGICMRRSADAPARDIQVNAYDEALTDPKETSLFERSGIRTLLGFPISRAGQRLGFLAFISNSRRHWADDDIALLRTAAEIFANTIERQRGESEREALAARLAQAQRLEAVGTLAGGIAHEFNNTLGVILGSAEMAMAKSVAGEGVRRHIRQIATAAERASGVVDQVLAFSRRRERRHRPVLVQPAVAEAIELIRASLPATVMLDTKLQAGETAVRGEATELQQVLMNLCTNAAHAMDGRGTIEITLDTNIVPHDRVLSHGNLAAGSYVRLAVRDSGHGMDAATLQRIFEPFFTTKPVGRGTGLGLPTVHGIVTAAGGALNVESRPGAGSTFEVYLPQTEPPAEGETQAPVSLFPQGKGETVLLVDDESSLVLLGEEMLAALGYEPVGFDGSRAALSAFMADPQRFDLALLDEVMPEMTGTELAGALRKTRPDLPIVLMTGYRSEIPAHRLRDAGIREVLAKPLRSATLAACLARNLRPAKVGIR